MKTIPSRKVAVVSVLLAIAVAGCSAHRVRLRGYEGPELRPSEKALVRPQWNNDAAVTIAKFDGTAVIPRLRKMGEFGWGSGLPITEVEVLPGPHTFEVTYRSARSERASTGAAAITFTAESGHVYEIHVREGPPPEQSGLEKVGYALIGLKKGTWYPWVEERERLE